MRRSLMKPGTTRSLAQAVVQHQPRRMFATPPTKKSTPPEPIEPSSEQAMPLGAYYETIMKYPQPIPEVKPEAPPKSSTEDLPAEPPRKHGKSKRKDEESKGTSSSTPPIPTPSEPTEPPAQAKAGITFGSQLLGPAERAERLAAIRSQSRLIAGVLVPPRPEEPDNCCMSGCVNCVWDRFRDDMELWASQNAKAERRLRAQEAGVAAATTAASMDAASTDPLTEAQSDLDATVTASMEDDGGGSPTDWDTGNIAGQGSGGTMTKDFWNEDLYKDIPVGIREFMKQEKRLKQKHQREGTVGG